MRLIILYCILFRKDFIEDSVMEAKTFEESNTVPGIIYNICKKKKLVDKIYMTYHHVFSCICKWIPPQIAYTLCRRIRGYYWTSCVLKWILEDHFLFFKVNNKWWMKLSN